MEVLPEKLICQHHVLCVTSPAGFLDNAYNNVMTLRFGKLGSQKFYAMFYYHWKVSLGHWEISFTIL